MNPNDDGPLSMNQVLDHVVERANGDNISVGEILQTLGRRSYGPALLFIAVISMLPPISITPGLPVVTGSLIILLSVQLLFFRPYPWLPQRILRVSFKRESLLAAVERARPWAHRLGRVASPRLSFLVRHPFVNVIAFLCVGLGLLTFALAPLPAGENIPTAAVLFFGLALTTQDGVLAMIGLVAAGVAIAGLIWFWPTIIGTFTELIPQLWHNTNKWFDQTGERIVLLWDIFLVLGVVFVALVFGTIARVAFLYGGNRNDQVQSRLGSLVTWWVLFGFLLLVVIIGKPAVILFWAIISILALREYRKLVGSRVSDGIVWLLLFLAVPIHYAFIYFEWLGAAWTFIPVWVFLVVLLRLDITGKTRNFLETAGISYVGLMLIGFLFSHTALLFVLPDELNLPGGATALFVYLILLTEGNDIAQALWGRRFGKRKIVPNVSPGKTWEGFLLGMVTVVGAALLLAPILTPFANGTFPFDGFELNIPYLPAFVAGVLIAVGGFFGDITISAVKREAGAKDTGNLLPGQGGVLDRIDSLMFTGPLFFYFTYFLYA